MTSEKTVSQTSFRQEINGVNVTFIRRSSGNRTLRKSVNKTRKTVNLGTTDINEAISVAGNHVSEIKARMIMTRLMEGETFSLKKGKQRRVFNVLDSDYSAIYSSSIKRSRARGIPFTLTEKELQSLVIRAGGKCEISGIPFSYKQDDHWSRSPYAPSLDRINACLGYSLSNCRLVCVAVNWAMSDWGEDVLRKVSLSIASKYLANHDGA